MKRIWKSLLVLAVFCLFSLGTAADEQIRVYLDGKEIAFDTPPTIINDNTLVPMRAVFEALGAEVQWNDEKQCVTANRYDTEIKLFVGQNCLYRNNLCKDMPCSSQLINDRVYVPVRAIAESFGCHVDWCEESNAVAIFTEKAMGQINEAICMDMSLFGGFVYTPFGSKNYETMFLKKGADAHDFTKAICFVPRDYTDYSKEYYETRNPQYLYQNVIEDSNSELVECYRQLMADCSPSSYIVSEINGFNSIKELANYCALFCDADIYQREATFQTAEEAVQGDHFLWRYWEHNNKLYLLYDCQYFVDFMGGGSPGGVDLTDRFAVKSLNANSLTVCIRGVFGYDIGVFRARFISKNNNLFLESVEWEEIQLTY